MVTIQNIADKLGIAVSTVSKGLNDAYDVSDSLKQKILDTAIEMGYFSKRMNAIGKHKMCILMKERYCKDKNPREYEIICGFENAAMENGCHVSKILIEEKMIFPCNYDSYMLKRGYCGAFFIGCELSEEWLESLKSTSVPTIVFEQYIPENIHVGYVGTDEFKGIYSAVHELVLYGHRKIFFLYDSEHSYAVIDRKRHAFSNVIKDFGLEKEHPELYNIPFNHKNAGHIIPSLIEKGATAFVCSSDLIAAGVLKQLHRMHISVPKDISIVGYEDSLVARLQNPPLTTIKQDRNALGQGAFLLLDGLCDDIYISSLLLQPEFIKRKSTGPVPGKAYES